MQALIPTPQSVLRSLMDTEERLRPRPPTKTFFLFIKKLGPGKLLRLLT